MRGLLVLTIAMAILILAGSAVLIATIVKRASTGSGAGPPFAAILNEPPGTHIGGIASVGDRLAVQLQGGGSDRVVLIDPRSGTSVGRIMLAH